MSETTVFIVDSWTPPPTGSLNRTIHVYTNAPLVRLWVNGRQASTSTVSFFGAATFDAVKFEPGNLTAEALDQSGSTRLATHTAETGGAAVQIRLSLDAPSPLFGTGDALVSDGQDVALVRAELVERFAIPARKDEAKAPDTSCSNGGHEENDFVGDVSDRDRDSVESD